MIKIVRIKSVKTNKTLEYFTGILRTKLLLNIIPYNQDKILRTDAINTFKVKITQYMEELFFPQTNPPSSYKNLTIHSIPFSSFYISSREGWGKKVWNERGHRMIYLECKSFLLEARGSPRFCVNFVETIRISFVPLSSLDIEYLPLVPTFHSPFPRQGRDSSLFPRGGIHLVENFQFCSSLLSSDCSSAGRRGRGEPISKENFEYLQVGRARTDIFEGTL